MSVNLSQEQIMAMMDAQHGMPPMAEGGTLTAEEEDILGEIGNMSMGAAATTMYTILGRKVNITTPKVFVYPNLVTMLEEYNVPYIVVEVEYTEGINGRNLLLLKTSDAAMITDIMMGGDGNVDPEHVELSEIHLSAISEIMNQMVASGATSLAQILSMVVNISPPKATLVDLAINDTGLWEGETDAIIKISFDMEIEGLLKSELMQVMPLSFGRELVDTLIKSQSAEAEKPPLEQSIQEEYTPYSAPADTPPPAAPVPAQYPEYAPPPGPQYAQPAPQYAPPPPQYNPPPMVPNPQYASSYSTPPVNVQPVQYQSFDPQPTSFNTVHENLDMIIDVPLQVTVELGKARKSIKEVLDFNIGSVIVLDKLAGELVEVVVNGKLIARGEVVVIDENYGVRINEIISPDKRV